MIIGPSMIGVVASQRIDAAEGFDALTTLNPVSGWSTFLRNSAYEGPIMTVATSQNSDTADLYEADMAKLPPFGQYTSLKTWYNQYDAGDDWNASGAGTWIVYDETQHTTMVAYGDATGTQLSTFTAGGSPDPAYNQETIFVAVSARKTASGGGPIFDMTLYDFTLEWGADMKFGFVNGGMSMTTITDTNWTTDSVIIQDEWLTAFFDINGTPAQSYINGVAKNTLAYTAPLTLPSSKLAFYDWAYGNFEGYVHEIMFFEQTATVAAGDITALNAYQAAIAGTIPKKTTASARLVDEQQWTSDGSGGANPWAISVDTSGISGTKTLLVMFMGATANVSGFSVDSMGGITATKIANVIRGYYAGTVGVIEDVDCTGSTVTLNIRRGGNYFDSGSVVVWDITDLIPGGGFAYDLSVDMDTLGHRMDVSDYASGASFAMVMASSASSTGVRGRKSLVSDLYTQDVVIQSLNGAVWVSAGSGESDGTNDTLQAMVRAGTGSLNTNLNIGLMVSVSPIAIAASLDDVYADTVLLMGFNGGSGATTATEEGPSGITLTYNGTAAASTVQTKMGASCLAVGSGNYVTFPSFTTITGDYTVAAWFYCTSRSSWDGIVGDFTNVTDSWCMWINNLGKIEFLVKNRGVLGSVVTVTTGRWYHAAFTRVGAKGILFVDGGIERVSTDASVATMDIGTLSLTNRIGGTGVGDPLDGYVDEVLIAKRAVLTQPFNPNIEFARS